MADRIITVTDPSIVTNDTLSGYNNYSDIDGQLGTTMTPTEATNGKTVTLSDGVVHEVTTKPVGTTNGEFSAVVSNAVTVDLVGGSGWDVANAVYDNKSFSAASQDSVTQKMVLSADGTKGYTAGNTNDSIFQYTLSIPFDVSTATYATKTFNCGTETGTTTNALRLSSDGTKLYVAGASAIFQYTLSTAWDIETATYDSVNKAIANSSATDFTFAQDGSQLFVISNGGTKKVVSYTLNSAWDISATGNQVTQNLESTASQIGIEINDDGTKLFIGNFPDVLVYTYTMSTPYLITSMTDDNTDLDVSSEVTGLRGMYAKPDGTKLYITGSNTVYQYSI